MNAEFNWWLLIVGLVLGAGLVWLVLSDTRRREADVVAAEQASEASWIAEAMADAGQPLSDDVVLEVLRRHADYLGLGPPDGPLETDGAAAWVAVPETTLAGEAQGPMVHPVPRPDDADGGIA